MLVNLFLCLLNLEVILNSTLEERVEMLEIQMVQAEDDIDNLGLDLTELEGDVDFLFDDQLIQNQRIFNLEEESSVLNEDVQGMSDMTALIAWN